MRVQLKHLVGRAALLRRPHREANGAAQQRRPTLRLIERD